MGVHIQGQGHYVHVAGPFPVAEQRAFHPLGTGHDSQLRSCHTFAPVVMGMDTDDGTIPVLHMADEIFDLIRIRIRRGHFHRGGQVDDDGLFLRSTQRIQHALPPPRQFS